MVLRLLINSLLCLGLLCPAYSWAAPAESAPEGPAAQLPILPGLSQLNQQAKTLEDFVTQAEAHLQSLADLDKPQEALTSLAVQFQNLSEEMKPLGSPDSWYVDRLNAYITQLSQLRQNLENLQQKIAMRQQEADGYQTLAGKDKEFWNSWAAELKQEELKLRRQTFNQVDSLLAKLDAGLSTTTEQLLLFEDQLGTLHREISLAENDLILAMGQLRKATFRKNSHSFFSSEFRQLFSENLATQTYTGLTAALKFDRRYLIENGLLIGLMLTGFLLTFAFLRHNQKRLRQSDEWHFILDHPLAAASFINVVIFWFWLPAPPPILHFSLLLLTTSSATVMALPLLENMRQVRVFVLAAVVILLTSAFRLIALPQPLFRVYLAVLAILFIPLLIQQMRLSKKLRKPGEGRFFRGLLRVAVIVLAISLFGQLAGYMNFSGWLVQATFETGTVLLFVKMAVLVISGAIGLGLDLLAQSGPDFFKHYGQEFSVRLKRLLKFIVYGFALFYLLPVWRLFATLNEGWTHISQLSIEVGQFNLSMQMLASAIIAFYLALQVSWVLQGVSDSQVLARRNADRGVRDAVKKLIHYGVVLIGFLFALSLLGLGLQNFVVLLGAFGVGIGFGLQDIVNNFLSGLILLFERPIKVGDGILVDGEYGTVTRIGLRSTVVESLDQAELIVPNSQIISQKVTNWTLSSRRVRLVIPVGVAYGSNLEKVLVVLTESGEQHPEVLKEPKPSPLFVQFGNSSLDFELRVWIKNIDNRPRIRNELLLYIDRRFREEKIEIPFPQQDLHLRSGFPVVLPESASAEK